MDIARKFPLGRIQKCSTIMGRNEKDDLGTFYFSLTDLFSCGIIDVSLHVMHRRFLPWC